MLGTMSLKARQSQSTNNERKSSLYWTISLKSRQKKTTRIRQLLKSFRTVKRSSETKDHFREVKPGIGRKGYLNGRPPKLTISPIFINPLRHTTRPQR